VDGVWNETVLDGRERERRGEDDAGGGGCGPAEPLPERWVVALFGIVFTARGSPGSAAVGEGGRAPTPAEPDDEGREPGGGRRMGSVCIGESAGGGGGGRGGGGGGG